jgi:signal transduction protein with GAF and PtsI domain
MKHLKKNTTLMLTAACLTLITGMAQLSHADESADSVDASSHHGRKCKKRAFRFGVCVGESLAQQEVILPAHVPGQKSRWNDNTKAAFKNAIESCRAQFPKKAQEIESEDNSTLEE